MKRFLYILLAEMLLCIGSAVGQNTLYIKEPVWHFGSTHEEGGAIEHTFTVENRSKRPLIILDIATSCGCTKPRFTRRPILPGQSEEITVKFQPAGQSGMVERRLTLYGERQQVLGQLTVSGEVIPRQRSIEERYMIEMGNGIRLTQNFLSLGELRQEEVRTLRIGVVNTSTEPRTLRFVAQTDSPYSKVVAPAVLQPNEEGEVVIQSLIPASSHHYGTWQESYTLQIDEKSSRVLLHLHALVVDPSPQGGGVARLERLNIYLGDVRHDHGPHQGELTIHNDGQEPLIVRAFAADKHLRLSLQGGEVIPAGGTLNATVWLDSSEMDYGGFSQKLHLIFSGEEPVRRLRVSGTVIE